MRYFISYFLLLALLVGTSTSPAAPRWCSWLLPSQATERLTPAVGYDFRSIFAEKGIPFEELRFAMEDEEISEGTFILKVYMGKDFIAEFDTSIGSGEELQPGVDLAWINTEYIGKGLGTFMYLAVAQWLFDEAGLVLHESYSTTPDADLVWARFNERGWVDPLPPQYRADEPRYRFRSEILARGDWRHLVDFIRTQPRED